MRDWDDYKDLVVGISVDGEKICLTKAKYEDAEALGVKSHEYHEDFYIDKLRPPNRN